MKPDIRKETIETCFSSKYLNVFDYRYAPGAHYYNGTRRSLDRLAALQGEEAFREMLPDAVSCIVILEQPQKEPLLLLTREFRYPAGRFLLGVPAGLIDASDDQGDRTETIYNAVRRELREETGLVLGEEDELTLVNPLAFSSPGLTDESNALVCVRARVKDLDFLTSEGTEASELFEGYLPTGLSEAREYLQNGRDRDGNFYSMYTWAALVWFVSGMWKSE